MPSIACRLPVAPSMEPGLVSVPAGRIRVLLAEDEDAVAALTEAVLADAERVELVGRARTGEEAVALTGELAPDLVLMDIAMPELDGIEATRRIRQRHPGVKVLVLSASRLESDRARAREAGAAGFIAKEQTVRELVAAIEALFAR